MELFDDLARDYMKNIIEYACRTRGFFYELKILLEAQGVDSGPSGYPERSTFPFYKWFNSRDWEDRDSVLPAIQLLEKALKYEACQVFIPGLNAILSSTHSKFEVRNGKMVHR